MEHSTETPTERIEIRAYSGEKAPALARVEVFEIPRDAQGASEEAGRLYRQFAREYDGVEYVVDVGGPDEDVTDYDGVCPSGIEARAADSGSWQREMAMEAGMLHGVNAYNEMMGCDVGSDEDDYYR